MMIILTSKEMVIKLIPQYHNCNLHIFRFLLKISKNISINFKRSIGKFIIFLRQIREIYFERLFLRIVLKDQPLNFMYIYIFFFLTTKQNSTKETSNIYIHSQIKWSDKCPNFCENLPALKQTEAAIKLSIRDRISHFVHHKFDENWHFSAPIVFAARYINHDNAVLYRAI